MPLADSATTDWIRRYHPADAGRTRLVCFPHAGGSASFYHPVSLRFSPDVDVVALQYPGRQDRRHEPLIDSIAELADQVAAQLLTLSARPTVFFGHSMGAVLAFETAWRLEQRHAGPRSLVLSGRRGPRTVRAENVHTWDDDDIVAELKVLNGTDLSLLDDDFLRIALPAIRNDYKAIESYTCPMGRVVRCPITVLTGDADPKTTIQEANSWRQHTTGHFRIQVFPGGHFYLVKQHDQVNAQIARELRTLERECQPNGQSHEPF